MKTSENGRFCSSCKNEVRDFTSSTVAEIKAAYVESNGELCGHVPVKLLQEEHVSWHLQKNHFGSMKKFFLAAFLCFGASLFTIDAAKASAIYKLKIGMFRNVASDTILVKGEVHDHSTREEIPFVKVVAISGDKTIATAFSDIEGKYTLKIPKEYLNIDIGIVYPGYVSKTMKGISIVPGKQIVVDFELEQEKEYITDGIIVFDRDPVINQDPGPSGKTIKRGEYRKMPK
jgi:hypothetical protein